MTDISKLDEVGIRIEQSLLYDFYGELLTEHQKLVYEDFLNDYSFSEIAKEQGISRQGVHDLIKRCNKILTDYEDKLHLVEKFQETKEKVNQIYKLSLLTEENQQESLNDIRKLSEEILENL